VTEKLKKIMATSVVGSYSVPEWLERLKTDFYQRRISGQYLDDIHEVAIKAALKGQERAGVDVVSDGELRRDNDVDYFLARMPGVEIRGYVPNLYEHFAACDLALVQGGLSTTMELVATGRPFLYFPLQRHFEQIFHVPHRLANYGVSDEARVDFSMVTPERLAEQITQSLTRAPEYRPVESGGAERAARVIAELL